MAINLSRDIKIFVSEVDTNFTPANTFRVLPLDGYEFNQDPETENVTLSEAGATPARGQKVFNTALNPVDVSFSTYVRPFLNGANHDSVERILWEALVGDAPLGTNVVPSTLGMNIDFDGSNKNELKSLFVFLEYGAGVDKQRFKIAEVIMGQVEIDFGIDAIAQLAWSGQGLTLEPITQGQMPQTGEFTDIPANAKFIKNKLSDITLSGDYNRTPGSYSMSQAIAGLADEADDTGLASSTQFFFGVTVDSGVEQTVAVTTNAGTTSWAELLDKINASLGGATVTGVFGFGNANLTFTSATVGTSSSVNVTAGSSSDLFAALDTANSSNFAGELDDVANATDGTTTNRSYDIPITGGSLTINNNVTFLTPEDLGVVNTSIGHFTGTREISGSITAYLRSGAGETGTGRLLEDLLQVLNETTTEFNMVMRLGGANPPNIEFTMPTAHLTIPKVENEDVISTTIEFTALGTDLDTTDEMTAVYKAV